MGSSVKPGGSTEPPAQGTDTAVRLGMYITLLAAFLSVFVLVEPWNMSRETAETFFSDGVALVLIFCLYCLISWSFLKTIAVVKRVV